MREREDTEQTPVLECRDLSVSYFTRAGEIPAVVDFNLKLMPGQAHGLVGESGCGKSTVALAIMRYLGRNGRIAGGELFVEGRDTASMSETELRDFLGASVAMVYQEPMASLNPSMRIGDQLAEVPYYRGGVTRPEAMHRALEMLAKVRVPDAERVLKCYPHQLSGGQQQRVVIAMALLANPKLLILDEPTTALDVTVEAGIVDLIKEIAAKSGTALLYISHNLGLILETCSHVTVMYSGEAVETGDVATVFDGMRHPYTRGLFASIPLPGTDKNARPLRAIPGQLPLPHDRPPGCAFGPRCAWFQPGRCDAAAVAMRETEEGSAHAVRCQRFEEIDLHAAQPIEAGRAPVPAGDVMLRVDGMSKHYDVGSLALGFGGSRLTVKANEDLTFEAREAETLAIVGESGCGKSTFAKVLMGLEEANGGKVWLADVDIARTPVHKRDRRIVSDLQMVFQNPFDTLNPSQTVGAQIARVIRKFGIETDKRKIRERVHALLDIVKLPRDVAGRKPRQLSGGQKQRVGIARAFAGKPGLVVADEPVSALDVSVQAAVTELLMNIQREHRTTLLFISHDLSVVRYLADRVVVMYLGRIMEQGTTEDIFAPPYHPYTEALLSAVPVADSTVQKRKVTISGEPPSATNPPEGCPFVTRCPHVLKGVCDTALPPVRAFGSGHRIACHLDPDQLLQMKPVFGLPEPGDGNPESAPA